MFRPFLHGCPAASPKVVALAVACVAFTLVARASSLTQSLSYDQNNGALLFSSSDAEEHGLTKPEKVKIALLLDQYDGKGGVAAMDQSKPDVVALKGESTSDEIITLAGDLQNAVSDNPIAFQQTITKLSNSEVQLKIEVRSAKPFEQKTLCLNFLLSKDFQGRSIIIDGNPVVLPTEVNESCLFFNTANQPVRHIVIPGMREALEISGEKLQVLFCQYPNGTGSLRLYLAPPNTEVAEAALTVKLRAKPYSAKPLDISAVANRAFQDDRRDDEAGGWTDQGHQNDLSTLPVGARMFGNVGFDLLDAGKNEGRACLAFANPARKYFLKSAEIAGHGERFAYLYLLHATAWTPREGEALCGIIEVRYEDGTTQGIEVKTGRDVGDWWEPVGLSNAVVVWKDKNQTGVDVGLYLSRFALENRKVSNIKFRTAENAVWLIAGASGVGEDYIPALPVTNDIPLSYVTQEDADWRTFEFSKDTVKDSAVDFSFLQDAPAGKYGPVIIRDGKFVFRDRLDKPVRFFGTNLNRTIVTGLSKAESERIADRMAGSGYNAVRFHHFDDSLIKEGATTPELDPAQLDRMDYLVHCLKERGIYVVIDLYISRLKGFDQKFSDLNEVKFAAAFVPEVRENIKAFASALLNHINPYTKLPLKDEPALATVALINEDALATHYTLEKISRHPYLQAAFKKAYRGWCEARQLKMPANPASDPQLLTRFLMDQQSDLYRDLRAFVKGLGVSHPLTDMSHRALYLMTAPRNEYDFVENHQYHDHPEYSGEAFLSDTVNHDQSVLSMLGRLFQHGAPRIFGKPFTLTEWNFCYPNRYRSESGPVMGGYAALQDWDGLFRFDYSEQKETAFGHTHTWAFNTVCDPMQMLSERIAALFFLRGDVAPATTRFTFGVTPEVWKLPIALDYLYYETFRNAWFPENFAMLAAYGQIGSNLITPETTSVPANAVITAENLPSLGDKLPVLEASGDFTSYLEKDGLLREYNFQPAQGIFLSETGQIFANTKILSFKTITARSECLVQKESAQTGKVLNVKGNTTFSTVFAGSVDGRELSNSQRLLVLHLTDLRNSQEKRTEYRGKLIIARGTGKYPLLVRKGSAEITLKSTNEGIPQIWALAVSGERLREVPFTRSAGELTFTASTVDGEIPSFAYEVVWNQPTVN